MALRVAVLDGRLHDRAAFSCGIAALDDYLRTRASQHARDGIATTHVLTDDAAPASILGYCTLSAAQLLLHELAEADRAAQRIMDRKHQATTELVIDVAGIAFRQHARLFEQFERRRIAPQGLLQPIETFRRIAQREPLARGCIHAAPGQILLGNVAAFELTGEPACGRFQHLEHAANLPILVAQARLARHLHAGLACELFHRIKKLQPVVLHQELQRRAVRAATEAVIETLGRGNGEAGRTFVVERAARLVFASGAFERHARADQFHDVDA